jgi:hypothetical protein
MQKSRAAWMSGEHVTRREPQTILKTDERSIHLELGRERKFDRQIKRLG